MRDKCGILWFLLFPRTSVDFPTPLGPHTATTGGSAPRADRARISAATAWAAAAQSCGEGGGQGRQHREEMRRSK